MRRLGWSLAAALLPACQLGYLTRQGLGQWSVLWNSRSVEEVLADSRFQEAEQGKIRLIQEIAGFGERELGLRRDGNYTTFLDTRGKPVSYSLFACPKTSLQPVVWRFPIVGTISYLGFFDLEEANEAAREMEEEGFDVHLGTVSAYSTLGWFRDPILSSMLGLDEVELARLILHEMTHATIFRPGEPEFNESLASFVGDHGAGIFLGLRYGVGSAQLDTLESRLRQETAFHAWLDALERKLRHLYAKPISEEEKLSRREEVFGASQGELRALSESLPDRPFRHFVEGRFNNALLLSLTTYRSDPELLEIAFRRCGRNLRRLLRRMEEVPSGGSAFQYLRREGALRKWSEEEEGTPGGGF